MYVFRWSEYSGRVNKIIDTLIIAIMIENILQKNLQDTLRDAIKYHALQRAVMVYDEQSLLARRIAQGYGEVLPDLLSVNFDQTSPAEIRGLIDKLSPKDLVILVQSSSFRLNDFRFRLELFNRGLAVIEHPHLGRMLPEEHETYIDSLAYDTVYYHAVGSMLKEKIDVAKRIVVFCEGTELIYEGPFESAKLNIGDYTGMKNIGGQFPIGEVFTEPQDFSRVNGTVKLFAYADARFQVIVPSEPVLVHIADGRIVDAPGAPESFRAVLDQIRADEPLWVRELGFGMNRALTRHKRLTDIGSYERMCGIHLSLGQKHTVYTKEGFPKRSSKYHVDVFADITKVMIDERIVYQEGQYMR